MTPIAVAVATAVAALAACAQDIRFVPGQGPAQSLSDSDRAVAMLAIDTLAADLQVPCEKVELDTVRAIDWRDSSIGCPKAGMAYLDVITPGVLQKKSAAVWPPRIRSEDGLSAVVMSMLSVLG
jgi:hypothetical protein